MTTTVHHVECEKPDIPKTNAFSVSIFVTVLLVASAFSPYVFPEFGLRGEHILIYFLFPFSLLILLRRKTEIAALGPLGSMLSVFVAVLILTSIITLTDDRAFAPKMLSHFENYAQPIALLIIVVGIIMPRDQEQAERAFKFAVATLLALLSANALLAVTCIFFDMTDFVDPFLGFRGGPDEVSLWARTASAGRYTGIFNQPVEAGLSYSLALSCGIFLLSRSEKYNSIILAALVLVTIGGIISLSKVFLLGGLAIGIIYGLYLLGLRRLLKARLIAGLIGSAVIVTTFIYQVAEDWRGLSILQNLFFNSTGRGALDLFTAGRFGLDESEVSSLYLTALIERPFTGYGFAPGPALDSAYLEYLLQGGLVCLLLYIFLLTKLIRYSIVGTREGAPYASLLLATTTLIVLAGIGSPIFTLNRFSTVYMIILCLVIICCEYSRQPSEPTRKGVIQDERSTV